MIPNQKRNKRRVVASDNFIEALRNLGGDIGDSAFEDLFKGIPEKAVDQLTGRTSGELKPNQALDMKQFSQEKEKRENLSRGFQEEFLDLRHQERLVWTKAEQETKLQIKAILEELKQLAASTEKLAEEVEVAAEQVPVEPGVYHLSFFEKLRQTIVLFKERIEESATWLAAFNQKAKKRNYYWAQVRKSGTKFLLSQERYMATQAG